MVKLPRPRGHVIQSRPIEFAVGILIAIAGLYLIWDCFDNRGKKMPWPMSGLAPW